MASGFPCETSDRSDDGAVQRLVRSTPEHAGADGRRGVLLTTALHDRRVDALLLLGQAHLVCVVLAVAVVLAHQALFEHALEVGDAILGAVASSVVDEVLEALRHLVRHGHLVPEREERVHEDAEGDEERDGDASDRVSHGEPPGS